MKNRSLLLAALVLAFGGAAGIAQVKALSLTELTTFADNAVIGTVVASRVIDLGNERDGYELYYTVFTVEGDSIYNGRKTSVDVVARGGWIDKDRGIGCWNSEAPHATEIAVGKQVVAYYKWVDNIGRGTGANILYASHGSLFRTAKGPNGLVVLGRGDGYAINKNMKLSSLRTASRTILDQAAKKKLEEQQQSDK
ncbi:MAG: hypothetical protein ACI8TQ_001195 [Planctomycetota bacterium]|jgi:hypothetical protein